MLKSFLFLSLLFLSNIIVAQNDTLKSVRLQAVKIKSSRISTEELKLPKAITVINAEETNALRQNVSLQEYLQQVPGLYITGANNFSQDLRISVRGFGARAAFGIRGIKIIVDGIPETTPDGQGQIDNINLDIIKDIEILRGSASSLYGNASGGTININTLDNLKSENVQVSPTFGSYGFQKYGVLAGINDEKNSFLFSGNYTTTNGYRQQSGFDNYNFNLKLKHRFSEKTSITLQANYTISPLADDAGGLTIEEVKENRQQARQRNVNFKTGENLKQIKFGAALDYTISENTTFATYAFYANRGFGNKLPFEDGGIVDLNRNYFGNGASITFSKLLKIKNNKLQIGYDLAAQYDRRKRYDNLNGDQGSLGFDQLESFSNFGIFLVDNYEFGQFLLQTGLRFDTNTLKAEDDYLVDGDESDEIILNAFSPSLGLSFNVNKNTAIFSNIATSFETPALSELSANPSGKGGFNTGLNAQKALNIDLGLRYKIKKSFIEAVIFYVKTKDDLVPFELAEFPDRTFYRNAGSTLRKGIEFNFSHLLFKNLKIRNAYTFSDFEYSDYTLPSGNFEGNKLPGLPDHKIYTSIIYQKDKIKIMAEGNYVSSIFANDANSNKVGGYITANLNLGYEANFGDSIVELSFGINNLFNTYYFDNIRTNAFGNRYYEPAATRNYFGKINFRI